MLPPIPTARASTGDSGVRHFHVDGAHRCSRFGCHVVVAEFLLFSLRLGHACPCFNQYSQLPKGQVPESWTIQQLQHPKHRGSDNTFRALAARIDIPRALPAAKGAWCRYQFRQYISSPPAITCTALASPALRPQTARFRQCISSPVLISAPQTARFGQFDLNFAWNFAMRRACDAEWHY